MAKPSSKTKGELPEDEANELRERLAAHDEALRKKSIAESRQRYLEADKFVNSDEFNKVRETAAKIASELASSTEDRTLFFALDNIRAAAEAVQTSLSQRMVALGVTPNQPDEDES